MDSGATKNHISPAAIKRIKLPHRHKENLYLLVMISGDLILYRDSIIHFKTGPVKVEIERQKIVVLFNILLLGKNEAVLEMLFLREFNLKINWITETVKIRNTQS